MHTSIRLTYGNLTPRAPYSIINFISMTTALNIVPLAYDRAANRFLGSFTEDEKKKYFGQPTSIDDIWDLVDDLQDQQGSRGSL